MEHPAPSPLTRLGGDRLLKSTHTSTQAMLVLHSYPETCTIIWRRSKPCLPILGEASGTMVSYLRELHLAISSAHLSMLRHLAIDLYRCNLRFQQMIRTFSHPTLVLYMLMLRGKVCHKAWQQGILAFMLCPHCPYRHHLRQQGLACRQVRPTCLHKDHMGPT